MAIQFENLEVARFLLRHGAFCDQSQTRCGDFIFDLEYLFMKISDTFPESDLNPDKIIDFVRDLLNSGSDICFIACIFNMIRHLYLLGDYHHLETLLNLLVKEYLIVDSDKLNGIFWSASPIIGIDFGTLIHSTKTLVDFKTQLAKLTRLTNKFANFSEHQSLVTFFLYDEPYVMEYPHQSQLFLSTMLIGGADPLAPEFDLTPTLVALMNNTVDIWFGALSEARISIDAVAKATVESVTPRLVTMLTPKVEEGKLGYTPYTWGSYASGVAKDGQTRASKLSNSLNSAAEFRTHLLEVFAEHGCHLNLPPDPIIPNEYQLSATSVDFVPSKTYDPSREGTELRKRKPTADQQAL